MGEAARFLFYCIDFPFLYKIPNGDVYEIKRPFYL